MVCRVNRFFGACLESVRLAFSQVVCLVSVFESLGNTLDENHGRPLFYDVRQDAISAARAWS